MKMRTIRSLVTLVVVALGFASIPGAASAAPSRKDIGAASSCTNNLMPSSAGTAYVGMNAYGTAERKATAAYIGAANVYGHVSTCPQGFGQTVSSITVELRYTITFSTITKCEVGIPSGVTCTIVNAGKTAIYKDVKTCTRTAGCSLTWPSAINVQSDDLDIPTLIQFKGTATAKQGSKTSVTTNNYVNW